MSGSMAVPAKAARAGRARPAAKDVMAPPHGVQKPAARAPTAFEARLYKVRDIELPRVTGVASVTLSEAILPSRCPSRKDPATWPPPLLSHSARHYF